MNLSEFADVVASSRSYRRFDESRPVSRELLEELVACARLAPTGNNTQLLRFHLSCERDEVLEVFSHHRWAALLRDWDGPAPGERPTAYVTVCGPAGSRASAIRNQDAGIAAQTLALAARASGLVGCMIASFDATLADALGLAEKNLEPLVLLALGYPAADERVVVEPADTPHGLSYWREREGGACGQRAQFLSVWTTHSASARSEPGLGAHSADLLTCGAPRSASAAASGHAILQQRPERDGAEQHEHGDNGKALIETEQHGGSLPQGD